MKVLAVCQHYWPEAFPMTAICEGLVQRGHEVTVLTGQPNYPIGKLFPGYEGQRVREEERSGVRIVRTKLHPRKSGVVHRAWNYHSFSRNGQAAVRHLDRDYDVVYSFQTSPVMMVRPAIAYSERTGVPLLLHCADIWPECLTAGGVPRGSTVYNHYLKISRRVYGAADRLAVTSLLFSDYLRDVVKVPGPEPAYLPQFVSEPSEDDAGADAIANSGKSSGMSNESLFPEEEFHFMFAGNVGSAQSVQTAVRAASLLVGTGAHVHVVGAGSELAACKRLAEKLPAGNVTFHGAHPTEFMPAYYSHADAMLVTFADEPVLAYTLPRKVQSYMAAGKPIVGSVAGAAERAIVEARCGLVVPPCDDVALAGAMERLMSLPQVELDGMGERARTFYETHFSEERFFESLESELHNLKGTKHGR